MHVHRFPCVEVCAVVGYDQVPGSLCNAIKPGSTCLTSFTVQHPTHTWESILFIGVKGLSRMPRPMAVSGDDCTSVDLLQRQLHVRHEVRQPNATTLRLKAALPMVWVHIPKCGTSFANTLVAMPHFCPSLPSNFDIEEYAVNGCYYKLMDPTICESVCDPEFFYCFPPGQYHLQVGNETEYAARILVWLESGGF